LLLPSRRLDGSCLLAELSTGSGPTYSMARAVGATEWQKGFICRCHYLRSVTVEVSSHVPTPGHIHEGY